MKTAYWPPWRPLLLSVMIFSFFSISCRIPAVKKITLGYSRLDHDFEDAHMTTIASALRFPNSYAGQEAIRALDERSGELLAPITVAYLIHRALASSRIEIVRTAISILKDIRPPGANQAVCPLWQTAIYYPDQFIQDMARDAALSFPAPTKEECLARWDKEGLSFKHAWYNNPPRRARRPREIFFR